jgi:hypothetical protein
MQQRFLLVLIEALLRPVFARGASFAALPDGARKVQVVSNTWDER